MKILLIAIYIIGIYFNYLNINGIIYELINKGLHKNMYKNVFDFAYNEFGVLTTCVLFFDLLGSWVIFLFCLPYKTALKSKLKFNWNEK
jgi:hypothetical protein